MRRLTGEERARSVKVDSSMSGPYLSLGQFPYR
jgi:hypothetical protein